MLQVCRHTRSPMASALALAVITVAALFAGEALGCPTCKDGIAESDPAAQRMAAGYFYSILFMMSMPFVILGTFGTVVYRSIRRARIDQSIDDPLDCSTPP